LKLLEEKRRQRGGHFYDLGEGFLKEAQKNTNHKGKD
jgi:hypothetical protein